MIFMSSCGFLHIYCIIIQQIFTECLLGTDSVPGTLLYRLLRHIHKDYHIYLILLYCRVVLRPFYRGETVANGK